MPKGASVYLKRLLRLRMRRKYLANRCLCINVRHGKIFPVVYYYYLLYIIILSQSQMRQIINTRAFVYVRIILCTVNTRVLLPFFFPFCRRRRLHRIFRKSLYIYNMGMGEGSTAAPTIYMTLRQK